MTYLEKLLDGAPVEWKPLGEVCLKTENVRWTALSPETEFQYIDLASVSVLHRQIEDTQVITSETAPSRAQQIVRTDDVLFGATRPTLNRLCVVPPQYDGQICSTGFCILRANRTVLLPRFLFHCLQEPLFQRHVVSNQQGTIYPMISNKRVREFLIPLPPLAVQEQIVEILDKFTALIEALETERTLRTRQYAYYRNKLLRFGKEVERKPLGDIGKVCMCRRIFREQTTPKGDIPFYKIGTFGREADAYISYELYEEYRRRYPFPKIGDVLISTSGTIGRLVIYDGAPAYFQDSNIVWINNDESLVLNRFLYYYYGIVSWKTDKGTIERLYNRNLEKIPIPIPPLAVQEQIVAVLDKFHTLVHSIREGLPAEIALRRRQYRYYRRLLLDFPRS